MSSPIIQWKDGEEGYCGNAKSDSNSLLFESKITPQKKTFSRAQPSCEGNVGEVNVRGTVANSTNFANAREHPRPLYMLRRLQPTFLKLDLLSSNALAGSTFVENDNYSTQ